MLKSMSSFSRPAAMGADDWDDLLRALESELEDLRIKFELEEEAGREELRRLTELRQREWLGGLRDMYERLLQHASLAIQDASRRKKFECFRAAARVPMDAGALAWAYCDLRNGTCGRQHRLGLHKRRAHRL